MRFLIGIDTGTNTGIAIWDSKDRCFLSIETVMLHQAMDVVKMMAEKNREEVIVLFEDANLRKYIPRGKDIKAEVGRAKGAGMVCRDGNIWREFCTANGISFEAIAPKDNVTKTKADYFKKITGWNGRTNEHGRDAAMLVFLKKR